MTPGELDWARRELEEATGALDSALVLLERGDRSGAANRLYYAAFHANRAALATRGRHARTHTGQIAVFREVFGPEPLLDELLEVRGYADYGPYERFTQTLEELDGYRSRVERFLERCRSILDEAERAGPDEPDPAPDD